MINRLFAFFALSLFLTGCGYGVKTDDEGGFEMKMPGQSIKVDKEGVEIDQGVQKLRVGKDEVDIQQPGQRIRVAGGDVDIDQGVQKLHLGKDGIDIQQPNQQAQLSKEGIKVEQTPLTVDKSTTAEHESNPFIEAGKSEPLEGDPNSTQKVESPETATQDEKDLGEQNPKAEEAKPVADEKAETNSVEVSPPPAKEVERPRPPARDLAPAAAREPTPRVATEQPAVERAAAAPARVDVPRSPLRLRLTAPLDQRDFSGQRVVQLNLAGRDLRGADFSNATIIQTDFGGCDLRGANFEGAEITQCSFEDAKLQNANFEKVTLKQGWFSGADFSGVSFRGAELTQTDFRASDLTMATFAEAQERSVKKP